MKKKKSKSPYKTKEEFIKAFIADEMGRISTYEHIKNLCSMCIKAHKKMATKKYAEKIAKMNPHLIEEVEDGE